jgi:hypothetical protein
MRAAANVGSETKMIHNGREVLWRRGSPRLAFEQRPHRRSVDVVNRQAMPGIEQLVRHRLAHGAEAQISRFHDDRPA